jgi:DNA-binding protein HU-beta
MNKSELISEVAKKTNLTQKDVGKTIEAFMDVIKDTLKKGDKITLVGFGTFEVRKRKATTGINPQTKEKIKIPAKKFAKLKFSDTVNKLLN